MGLKEFMAEVRGRGVASRSHYVVEITPPPFLMTSSAAVPIIPLFCEQAMFPEFVLPTQPVKDGGLTREVVYDKLFGQLSMTFMCDQQMLIKEFFDKWVQAPVKTDGGIFMYPANYIVPTMTIYQIDEKKQKVYGVVVKNVYPKVINDVMLSASDRSVVSFQVVFAYESWASERYEVDLSVPSRGTQIASVEYNGVQRRSSTFISDTDTEVARYTGVQRSSPTFMTDIAGIADLATLSSDSIKSSIITRGKLALIQVMSSRTPSLLTGGIAGMNNLNAAIPTLSRQ
jgi:hypothetical protein